MKGILSLVEVRSVCATLLIVMYPRIWVRVWNATYLGVGETLGNSGGVKDHHIPRAVTHYRTTLAGLLQLKWKTKNRVCVPIP
jgi:hypothetical protein